MIRYSTTDKLLLGIGKALLYRFLIPETAADAINSQKEDTIRRLKEHYSCRIVLTPNNGPEKILLINADIDKLCAILAEIFDIVKDCMHSKINDPVDIASGKMPDDMFSDEIDLRFLVSENVREAIVGKDEQVICRLTDTHRVTTINVYKQKCPGSSDRIIRLVGLPSHVLNCFRGIHDVILSLKDIRSAHEYDPNNYNEMHAVNYGGWMSLEARHRLANSGGPPAATQGPTPMGKPKKEMVTYVHPIPLPLVDGQTLGQMAARHHPQNIIREIFPDRPPSILDRPYHMDDDRPTVGEMADRLRSECILFDVGQYAMESLLNTPKKFVRPRLTVPMPPRPRLPPAPNV